MLMDVLWLFPTPHPPRTSPAVISLTVLTIPSAVSFSLNVVLVTFADLLAAAFPPVAFQLVRLLKL